MNDPGDLEQRMADLEQAVSRRLAQAGGPAGPPLVLVSASGGADSTFLLHLLHRIAQSQPLRLHVMHIDHGQRAASHRDAQFVAAMCRDLDLPCHVHALTTTERKTAEAGNRQAALRDVRYRRLADQALSLAAPGQIPIIATGHHAHDLAETLLMNLVRGTGMHGLRGMQEWQTWTVAPAGSAREAQAPIHLYRPLLHWDRPSIQSLLTQWGVAWRDDPSNQDTRYVRNRIRHEVIPVLESLNPRFIRNLAQRSRDWTAMFDGLQQLHADNWQQVVVATQSAGERLAAVIWDLDRFQALPAWQQTGFLHAAFRRLQPARAGISSARLENLAGALAAVTRSGGPWPWFQDLAWSSWYRPDPNLLGLPPTRLLISLHQAAARPFVLDHPALPAQTPDALSIRIQDADGYSLLPAAQRVGDWRLVLHETAVASLPADWPTRNRPWQVWLDLDRLEAAGPCLQLAPPRRRAHMQPLGMAGGHKRLDRLLRDRRIHKSLHAVWPVLYAPPDTAVWMCGLHLDRRFALHAGSHRVVAIRWDRAAG